MSSTYHHGNLRRAVLDAAVAAIEESGPSGWSLRELARRAGVSHAAPAHHFGDKTGLLTALAAEGFDLLTEALTDSGGDLLDLGVAYVRFAAEHRAHFEVMFRPELYRGDDAELAAARTRTAAMLDRAVRALSPDPDASLAAWSIAHGFAGLWLSGALPPGLGGDPSSAARPVLAKLFAVREDAPPGP
ncbi:TetR/AcrR family transcriptional regulator [Actinomadura oligospora]|uniref:TetR/AcrR family transcriptional regulator n=1 Tax=Actinomadura oligospora TaxID=111804 RepID=UPI00047E09BD|nr:TetR/AcrR family transcriptional regulator [Actinomadura oligospora]